MNTSLIAQASSGHSTSSVTPATPHNYLYSEPMYRAAAHSAPAHYLHKCTNPLHRTWRTFSFSSEGLLSTTIFRFCAAAIATGRPGHSALDARLQGSGFKLIS